MSERHQFDNSQFGRQSLNITGQLLLTGYLFSETCLVNHQNTIVVTKVFGDIVLQIIANVIDIPLRSPNEMLNVSWRCIPRLLYKLPSPFFLRTKTTKIKRFRGSATEVLVLRNPSEIPVKS